MWSRAEEQSLPPTESPLCARYCVHVMSSNPQGNSRKTDVQSTDKETDAQWWEAGHGSRPCRFPALKSLIDWLTCSSFLSFILQIFIVLSSEGGIWFFLSESHFLPSPYWALQLTGSFPSCKEKRQKWSAWVQALWAWSASGSEGWDCLLDPGKERKVKGRLWPYP